jgi:hypothetical protein
MRTIFSAVFLAAGLLTIRAEPVDYFRAGEIQFDLFGTARGQNFDDYRVGAGAGVNYFFLRNLGVGLSGYSENSAHSVVDAADASIYLRFPFNRFNRVAPYGFAGTGYNFEDRQTSIHSGAGIEFRFNAHLGAFTDLRWTFDTDEPLDTGRSIWRAGIRIAF